MTTGTFDRLDGAGNHKQFQVNQIGNVELDDHVIADGLTGLTAQVANHTASNQNLPSGVFSLLVGAIGKLMNAAGVNFDAHRTAGGDAGSAAGVAAIGAMLEQEVRITSTTTVAASATSATLSVGLTTGFVAGAPIVFEPGTANAETALITTIVTNTSVSVQFPPGGALFTHTANYTILTGLMNAARQAPGGTGVTAVSSDGSKPTYRYAVQGITPVATPTDVLQITGSATMTGRIKRIKVGGIATTAGGLVCQLIRRSTAGTIGSATLVSVVAEKHDINDPAPTCTVKYVQTANYGTPGSTAGTADVGRLFLNVAATGPTTEVVFEFARLQDKSQILRGTSDFLWVNFAGATLPTGTALDFSVEIEEDGS